MIKGCEMDLCSKSKQLAAMQESVEETRGELELKEKQLRETKTDLARCCDEVDAEKENLGKIQNDARTLKEESDKRLADLTLVLETQVRCNKQLAFAEEKLASLQKLQEIRSSELRSKEMELDAVKESVRSCNLDLDSKRKEVASLEKSVRESRENLDTKRAELGEIQNLIDEQTHELAVKLKRRDSIEELIRKITEELAAKEKRREEMSESLRSLSSEIESREKKLTRTEETVKKLSEKLHSKEKHLESTQRHLQLCTIQLNSKQNDFDVLMEMLRRSSMDLELRQKDFKSLQLHITDYRTQANAIEKKVQDLESSIEVKQAMLSSIKRSVVSVTDELASKEHELSSVKMKIEETVKENKSKEEQYMRLGESLKKREEELVEKEKQFNACVKSFELKEQHLESERRKFSKTVDEFEQKVKKMSRFCQQGKTDQSGNSLRNPNPKDDKSLLLLLNGYLKKCPQLHVEVSDALKASPDPARLVLDVLQRLYSPSPTIKETEIDEDVVRKGCICLLECLMAISPEIKPGVQAEAIKLATEFKDKTLVKAENAVEVMGFLHFLAAFSLAYAFSNGELQSLFDVVTLRRYAPSLVKALGLSALASVDDVLSSEDKFGQPEDINSNDNAATCSLPSGIQLNPEASELVCELRPHEDALMDTEVSAALRSSPDPAKFVLDLIQEAFRGATQQGEMTGIEEPVMNYCNLLLEELVKISRQITPHVQWEASKLANQWRGRLETTRTPTSSEALGFLLLLASFNLVNFFNQVDIPKLAYSVAFYRYAPKLFQSLGISSDVIRDLVLRLIRRDHYIPAIRLIYSYELNFPMSPMPLLKKEIEDLRQSTCNIQVKGKDARKMRAILELVSDYKLDIHLPGDLVAKFMFQRGNQSQLPISTPLQMQTQSEASRGSGPSYPMSHRCCLLSHPQAVGQVQNRGGVKRHRSETWEGRNMVRRLHPPGNGGC
ncbi:PREDICTED: FRIGIDA-like protein 5 [Tarenaya hassleriana]|uniref:FRIGIDA-like protein 5 n=1 Tax=Tarenaya hassleriana TaxID=28532 RepID=UPI0008FD0A6E|nr:PREDICTED: FRIGIDA-like protein 5 [Tarenaya hassleriana]